MAKADKTTEKQQAKREQMSTVLNAPKPDKDRAPREDNYGKKERQTPKQDINAEGEGKDKVYGVASRARWGGDTSIHELTQESAQVESQVTKE